MTQYEQDLADAYELGRLRGRSEILVEQLRESTDDLHRQVVAEARACGVPV